MLKKLSSYLEFSDNSQKSAFNERGRSSKFKEGFNFLNLIKSWKEIAGEKLSEHTIPLKNQNGTLVILSNHSAFAHQLSFMELPLKKKIFEKFPILEESIKNIKFTVDSTHFDQQKAQFAMREGVPKKDNPNLLHPYSPEYRQLKKMAQEMYKDIQDDDIRESFISLHIQVLGSKN